jgi:RNA 2',3'-cyclic 3'-phosphodiesterase
MCALRRRVPHGQLGAAALTTSMAAREDWHRCFIALVPDAATRDVFAAMPVDAAVRRVPIDQLHLTLAFLGSIAEDKGELLAAALPSVVVPLPALTIGRIEYWPSRSRPRLAVLAFTASDELAELEARVRTLVTGLGLPIDDHRPFLPHVTLARLPRNAKPIALTPLADGNRDPHGEAAAADYAASRFDTLTLYSSTLARRGARYRPLASVHVPSH